MFDLRWLRENPDAFDRSLARRGQPPAAQKLLDVDLQLRLVEGQLQEAQTERNSLSRDIGQAKAKKLDAQPLMDMVTHLKEGIRLLEERARDLKLQLDTELAAYPNILADDVPDGPDEAHNVVLRQVGTPRSFNFKALPHEELGLPLGMSFEKAAKLSGARFTVLMGQMARLERALGQFMLDIQTREHGYTEVAVPYLVRAPALYGTNQLPKFADDLFRTTSDHWLIPTAEVPLTNLIAGELLAEAELPLRYTALSPCFRSEAGAAGKDTKGMIRQHQFIKVEMVSITTPEQSAAEHARMTSCAEAVLQRLELPYQVLALCAGDTGFGATKTYDIEVWLPGQERYREISSCSNCGDFQARRMDARFRPKEGKGTRFVHSLNGSGLAVGRTLIAVLENYQEQDGSVRVPDALLPYMAGIERLTPEG